MYFHILINCNKMININTEHNVKRYTYITKISDIMTKVIIFLILGKNLMKNYKNKKK